MNLNGFFSITRPLNSIVSGLTAVIGYLVATGTITPECLILIPAVFCITAGGNVVNDYCDAGIDAVNRPDRPIPSGVVSKNAARSFALILFLLGIILALFTGPLCLAIVIVNSLLLVVYAARFKSMPFIGNITVAYLAGSIFLFGGAFAGISGLLLNVPLAAITFLATLARELLKDAEDIEGDAAGGATTLPMRIGIKNTGRLALICSILAICASITPVQRWGLLYLAGIAVADAVILAAAIRALSCDTPACVRESGTTTILKAGFFVSLLVFSLAAYFL